MEFTYYFSLFLLFLLSCFVFVLIFSKTKQNLPPGPRKLPIIGHLHHLAGTAPPHHTLRHLADKHGPLMHLQLGECGYVIASSTEIATHFFKTHDALFASRPSILASEIGAYNNTDISFAPYGKFWRQLRRICSVELLSAKRVKSFQPVREEEATELCKWIAQREGSAINLGEKVQQMNYHIMGRAVLGKKTGEQAAFIALVKEGLDLMSGLDIVDLYPSYRILRLFSRLKRRIEKHHHAMDRIAHNIIEDRKRSDNGEHRDHDLLDVLLGLQDDKSLEIPLTTDNIKAVLGDLFGAGVETSSTTVEWAMAEMLKHPKVLKKAQDEVRMVFDAKNGVVDECYFDELKYLKLIVKESLRLHPPGPLLLPRVSSERCEINGYEIPAKTRLLVNVYAIARDPKCWEDGESFKPERFLEKSVDFMGSSIELIPFGAGRRICPGITFGVATVEIALAMLLYYFDWVLPEGMKAEDLDMTDWPGIAARKKDNLWAVPLVRRTLPA
uniref:Cytochrome P450 n=1 Tax=Ajuga reptans TaxID=38596 RepID=A0A0M4U0E0_AJURE|nr:cytochrome P450 [Ajuga reptans]